MIRLVVQPGESVYLAVSGSVLFDLWRLSYIYKLTITREARVFIEYIRRQTKFVSFYLSNFQLLFTQSSHEPSGLASMYGCSLLLSVLQASWNNSIQHQSWWINVSKHTITFVISIISRHWDCIGWRHPPSWKTKTSLFDVVNKTNTALFYVINKTKTSSFYVVNKTKTNLFYVINKTKTSLFYVVNKTKTCLFYVVNKTQTSLFDVVNKKNTSLSYVVNKSKTSYFT